MPLVSIVIPVYNSEKYLEKSLDSVINQTLQDIEIICVDDGSIDGSWCIIESYARKDSRIRTIQKENGGLVSARKAGTELARGQYIGYVDSDDWIEPDMYEKLFVIAEKHQADMVSSGYFFEGNYITINYDNVPEGLYENEKILYLRENSIYNLKAKDVGIRGSLCCKLFRTELLKAVQKEISDKLTFSEDKMCVISYVLQANRVYMLKQAFYHYISHASSMVHTADLDYLASVNEVYQHFIKLYNHRNFTPGMRMQAEVYITELLYKGINSRLGFQNKNLFWIDPYYLEDIPPNTKVVLYGGGELGHAYRQQILGRKDMAFVGCVDYAYEKMEQDELNVSSPKELLQWDYDIVLITIKNQEKATEIKHILEGMGVVREKIRWYEQKEIFWKYAQINGWLK